MNDVFLIGDSIRMGYCAGVKTLLEGRANVLYPEVNCCYSQNIFMNLPAWSDALCKEKSQVKAVHWNSGHWDAAHFYGMPFPLNSLSTYKESLQHVHWLIRKLFPEAKVIFATTTPMNPNGQQPANSRTTAEIAAYNEVALDVMEQLGVEVNDLFQFTSQWDSSYFNDFCHFAPKGNELLAEKVVQVVSPYCC